MKYKGYEIIEYTDLVPAGSYASKLVKIENLSSGKVFHYIVKISGTLHAIKKIDTEEKFISESLDYIKEKLDEEVEESDFEINITTDSRKKDLGIFYTDPMVVDCIFDILNIWKRKEDLEQSRWDSHKPVHYPSVIDPSVGEGLFLKTAIEKGFTKKEYIFGLDLDEKVVEKWPEINLLKTFGGKMDDLEAHFFHQNGLDKIHWEQHKDKYKNLKKDNVENQEFDAVVGNPPYGGIGVQPDHLDTPSMVENLSKFTLLRKGVKDPYRTPDDDVTNELFSRANQITLLDVANDPGPILKKKNIEKLKSFPIEVLFIERFLQLAKPGGWVAIILPDGIFSNANLEYVRKFIVLEAFLEGIISLPREAFKNAGTSAKTSVLLLKKYKNNEERQDNYPVFLASIEKMEQAAFDNLLLNYERYYK